MSNFNEKIFTIFNGQGKLVQVEYAIKAIKLCNFSNLAIKNKNGVVVVSQKLIPYSLCDQSFITHIYNITKTIGAMIIGSDGDSRTWISNIKQEAFKYKQDNGCDITVDVLAQLVADKAQSTTQVVGKRTLASEVVLVSYDQEYGPLLYKVDSSGSFFGYRGISSGLKEQELQNNIEKELREINVDTLSNDELIRLAINILQNTLGMDLKVNDFEVGIVNQNQMQFRKLNNQELEEHLNILQKFD